MRYKNLILIILAALLVALVYLKNSWVADDGFIAFRSVEQLFAGNGPRWNPHERSQVFTSPMWFAVLSVSRVFSSELYLNAIIIGAVFLSVTLYVLYRMVNNVLVFWAIVFLLLSSNGFFDFTSSGLENSLAYLLIAVYLYLYAFPRHGRILWLCLVFGIILLVRHDLATLLLVPTAYMVWSNRHAGRKANIAAISLVVSPLFAWTIFSVIYYGFPLPNTYYAKLATGIARTDIIFNHAVYYWFATLWRDSITIVCIALALFLGIRGSMPVRALALGVGMNLLYVTYTGGDFMLGRFLSYAYLVSVGIIWMVYRDYMSAHQGMAFSWSSLSLLPLSLTRIVVAVAVLLMVIPYAWYYVASALIIPVSVGSLGPRDYGHTPLNSPLLMRNALAFHGVANERTAHGNDTHIISYIKHRMYGDDFPSGMVEWGKRGSAFKQSDRNVELMGALGIFGYRSGTEKSVIDYYALSDPLLARLPSLPNQRISHWSRCIPMEYVTTVSTGKNHLADPELARYYDRLSTITQGPLFSADRWKQIVLFNTVDRRAPVPDDYGDDCMQ